METGYDYLLIRGRLQRRVARFTGVFLLVFGLLLLASGGAYYGYSANAKSNLDELVAVLEPRTIPAISGSFVSNVSLFPGKALTADSWDDPYAYEPAYLKERALLKGFSPIGENGVSVAYIPPSTRILIPAIGVDSTVSELSILDLGDSRTY